MVPVFFPLFSKDEIFRTFGRLAMNSPRRADGRTRGCFSTVVVVVVVGSCAKSGENLTPSEREDQSLRTNLMVVVSHIFNEVVDNTKVGNLLSGGG